MNNFKLCVFTIFVLTLHSAHTFAIVGVNFPSPPLDVCQVRYEIDNNKKQLCTGTLISPNLFLTAGHCDKGRESVPTFIDCPFTRTIAVIARSKPNEYVGPSDPFSTFDIAILKTEVSLPGPFAKMAQSKSEVNYLIRKNLGCFAMGSGHKYQTRGAVDSVRISFPSYVGFDMVTSSAWAASFLRWVHGDRRKSDKQRNGNPWLILNDAELVAGDSGGPVFCLNDKTERVLVATHSVIAMKPFSLLISKNIEWINSHISADK